tara:strand:- start:2493 stop:2789 length:297 start_codon:yes stop_codon:yes gene_type:complete
MSRSITEEESKNLLKDIMGDYLNELGINWDNHKRVPKKDDTFRITAEALSLPALIHLSEHKNVRNVYFHPSVSPPGKGDVISMRYRVYIEYKKIEDEK